MKKLLLYVLLVFVVGGVAYASDVNFSDSNPKSIFLDQTISIDCSIEADGLYKFDLVVTTLDTIYVEKRDTLDLKSTNSFNYVYKNVNLNGLGQKLNLRISKFMEDGFWSVPIESDDIHVVKSNIISFSHTGSFNYMKNGAKCVFEINNKYIDTNRVTIFSEYTNGLYANKKIDLIQNVNIFNSDTSKVFVFYPYISTIGEVQFFMSFNGDTLNTTSFRIGFDGINFTVDTLLEKLNRSINLNLEKDSLIVILQDSLLKLNKDTLTVYANWVDGTTSVERYSTSYIKANYAIDTDKESIQVPYELLNITKPFMFKIYNINGVVFYENNTWLNQVSHISFPELVDSNYYFVFLENDKKEMKWLYTIVK